MRRSIAVFFAFFGLMGMAAVQASPVGAKPPQEEVFDDYIVLFPDTNINRSVFINITAREFCGWLNQPGGPQGPPPAIDPVVGIGVETGKGAIVGKIDATHLHIEMWNFDEDPSPLIGPCEDIQEQLADPDAEPWAVGLADFKAKSNDVTDSGTRGNSFGDRTTARVTDQDGNEWSYRNVFRLNSKCNAPEFAPPSCLVDNSQLRQLK